MNTYLVGSPRNPRTRARKHTIQPHESTTPPVQKSLFRRKARKDNGSQLPDEDADDDDDSEDSDDATGGAQKPNYYLAKKFSDNLEPPFHLRYDSCTDMSLSRGGGRGGGIPLFHLGV